MLSLLLLASAQLAKPNIIYIMVDDLGYGELGCYGQEKIPTPNIDRLAKEGVKFTRFYSASPVCAPTRASLMTGLHQGHSPIRGNKENGGFGPNDAEGQMALPTETLTIAEHLKANGYTTGVIGKWGLGGPKPGATPMDHGFDFFYGYLCQRRAHNHYPTYLWKNYQPDLLQNNTYNAHQKATTVPEDLSEYAKVYGGKDYAHAKCLAEGKQFIKAAKGKPFFLYYASTIPHAALQAPPEWIEKFPTEWDPKPYLGEQGYLPTPRPRATYAAMISYLDYSVGELRKSIEEAGVADNTLIVFTSDNGATFNGGVDKQFFKSNGNFRGAKMSLYEGGHRVPFIAWSPGRIKPSTTVDTPFACYDTFASLTEWAGLPSIATDGTSYAPALAGKASKSRDFLYFEYPEASAMQSVHFGNMKVIRPDLKKKPELIEVYNLSDDPSEKRDLASTMPELVERARKVFAKEHVPNPAFPLGLVDKK